MTEKNSLQLENLKLTILCISVSLAVGIAAIALLLQFHLIFALAIAVIAAGGTGWSISTRLIDGRWPSPQPVLACLLWVAVAYGTWPGIKPFEPASRGTYASKQDYIRER
ncbi:MAG TPA: hypothetical protein VK934_11960, partial [Fimbriimonas sp.]|nr:hypothetical protein [Fimbriimonas sp.]